MPHQVQSSLMFEVCHIKTSIPMCLKYITSDLVPLVFEVCHIRSGAPLYLKYVTSSLVPLVFEVCHIKTRILMCLK